MDLITLPLIGLSLLSSLTFGGTLAATNEAPATSSDTASSIRCEEDMDCWDCDTMGNRICGDPNLGPAWESFDASSAPLKYDDKVVISYVEVVHQNPTGDLSPTQVAIRSIYDVHTWYIFEYVAFTDA